MYGDRPRWHRKNAGFEPDPKHFSFCSPDVGSAL
jgi:hypothetical protein